MTHTEFLGECVERAQKSKTHEDVTEIMLNTIAESLAAIADALEDIADHLEREE